MASNDGPAEGADLRRLEFLAEIGATLVSLDPKRILGDLTRVVVPELADWALAYLVEEGGRIRRVAMGHADASKAELAEEIEQEFWIVPDAPVGLPRVIRTGEAEFYPRATAALLAADVQEPERMEPMLRELGVRSWICIPLSARGRVLGALSLVYAESGRNYTPADLALAKTLAQRASLAVDNALLVSDLEFQQVLLRSQSEATIDGILVVDPEGKIISFNQRFVEMWGIPPEVIKTGSDEAAIEFVVDQLEDPEAFIARIRHLYAHPEERSRDVLHLRDGRTFDRWSAPLTGPDGAPYGRAWYVRDVTDFARVEEILRENQRRAELLAEAGSLFAASLDDQVIAKGLAELVARNLAEWCAVDLRGEGRELERVAESPDGGARPKTGTEVVVPLVGREGPLGALTFGWDAPDRTASPEELGLAEDLCRRAALAVENARLYAERTHVARILQQSLLPDRLPAIEGLEVDARLHAAGQAVGGDFYDLFEIGDGRWGFVLGDVCGKGVDAARLTALTRYTVRAASMRIASPDGVLEVLNDVLLRDRAGDVNLCTVAFAVITVEEGRVTLELTNGGHPLPLRIAGGRVDSAGGPGTILGAFREPDLTTLRLTLGRGDTLVFYTDGVIEAKDPAREVFGEPRLRDLLAELRDAPPDEVTAAIVEAALRFQAGKVRDDIAVVAFRVPSA